MKFENHSTIKLSNARLLNKVAENVSNILNTLNYKGEMYLVDTEVKTSCGKTLRGVDLFMHRNGKTYVAKTFFKLYVPENIKNDNTAYLEHISSLTDEIREYETAGIYFVPKGYDFTEESGEEIFNTCPCCGVCVLSINYYKEDKCIDIEFYTEDGKSRIDITNFIDDENNDDDTETPEPTPIGTFTDSI